MIIQTIKSSSQKKKDKKIEIPFPRLMIDSRNLLIFMFGTYIHSHKEKSLMGIVIQDDNDDYGVGYYSPNWNFHNFGNYQGKVTMNNYFENDE